jgi:hypothetical protein
MVVERDKNRVGTRASKTSLRTIGLKYAPCVMPGLV